MLAKYAVTVVQDGNTPSGKRKTSDFLRQNIRTFASKVRHFYAKKSDVFNCRNVAIGLYPEVFCLLVAGSENVCGLLSGRDDGVG